MLQAVPSPAVDRHAGDHCGARPGTDRASRRRRSCRFEKYTLPNGLEVILVEDRRLPLVAVNLWYHVGPANEKPGRTGFAHLFEHMMFQGSKHVPGDGHFAAARRRRRERPERHDRLRSHQLLRDRAVEPARAGAVARERPHGLPARDARPGEADEPAGRRAQRAAAERREPALRHGRRGGVPHAVPEGTSVLRARSSARTPTSRPRSSTTCASSSSEYYAPNNATLAIVGDIDKARAKALVEKYFGPIPARQAGARSRTSRRRRSPPRSA